MSYMRVGGVALLATMAAEAADEATQQRRTEVSGGVTATALAAEGGRADPTLAGSFDLLLETQQGDHTWVLYVEGSSSVNSGSVGAIYPEANADAGTAVVNGSEGTVQVSELKYRWQATPEQRFTIGVVDTGAYMDLSGTANDENTQFLNAWLVNNPTIEFPDYTPGLVYEQQSELGDLYALLASSHGLADNADHSWAQMLDLGAKGKGAFLAAGLRATGGAWSWEAGAWGNSADHATLDGAHTGRVNYGFYGVLGAAAEGMGFDLRLGYADPEVNEANLFAAGSVAFQLSQMTLGLGYARSTLAPDADEPGRAGETAAEIYLRVPVGAVEVTFDLQSLESPGFDADAPTAHVGGVRVHYAL